MSVRWLAVLLWSTMQLQAAGPREEALRYQISWPSGLSLGEGLLKATKDGSRWKYELQLEAAVPAFRVVDIYRSLATDKMCSLDFEKEFEHGPKKGKEKTVFADLKATRTTLPGGGSSAVDAPACAKDALNFIFYLREEVAKGRIPAAQKIYFGSAYDVRAQFIGVETVTVSDGPLETDHLKIHLSGAVSKLDFDVFLARDEARTPALIRVPFVMGTFALEWVR